MGREKLTLGPRLALAIYSHVFYPHQFPSLASCWFPVSSISICKTSQREEHSRCANVKHPFFRLLASQISSSPILLQHSPVIFYTRRWLGRLHIPPLSILCGHVLLSSSSSPRLVTSSIQPLPPADLYQGLNKQPAVPHSMLTCLSPCAVAQLCVDGTRAGSTSLNSHPTMSSQCDSSFLDQISSPIFLLPPHTFPISPLLAL